MPFTAYQTYSQSEESDEQELGDATVLGFLLNILFHWDFLAQRKQTVNLRTGSEKLLYTEWESSS